MDILTLAIYFIFSLAIAAIALQITDYSYLSMIIKNFLYLNIEYDKKLTLFSKIRTYYKLLPTWLFVITFPITFIVAIGLKIHYLLSLLFNCKYCLSYDLTLITLLFYFNEGIITSIILSGFGVISAHILSKID